MIVSCPTCNARMKADAQRLGGKRITIRCSRCRNVFKADIAPATEPDAAARQKSAVLLAHSDQELCDAIGEILDREGIGYQVCHDGHEALQMMDADPPAVALVDVALPGLYAFEVVEKVRKRPGLENVSIILLSSVYNKAAYKRFPSSLYGADDYLEKHHIFDQLAVKVRQLCGDPTAEKVHWSSPTMVGDSMPETKEFVQQINTRIQEAEEHEVTPKAADSALEKARRLARIIVSDIALYNEQKVEEGIRAGTFYDLLQTDIMEGRRLFTERVPAELREQEDILQRAFDAFIERRKMELQG